MELVMNASILASIVLCLVGIIKLPFVKFKGKKFYKAGFTLLTIALTIASCLICQKFILHASIISVSMVYLLLMTFGETMLSYNGIYEGLHLKDLCKTLVGKIKTLLAKKPDNELTKWANKVGLDNAINIVNKLIEEKSKVAEEVVEVKPEVNEVKPEVKVEIPTVAKEI